jgi:23S rRNA pseudouridine2605 synthase
LDKPIADADVETLIHGIELEDGFSRFDKFSVVTDDALVVSVTLHSGKNRIVRRMFAHLGYEVEKLDRVQYAGLTKKNLERGKWRFLDKQEIIRLKHFVS